MSIANPLPRAHLRQQFAALRRQGRCTRDAAHQLGLSEGEAMAAHAAGAMQSPEEAASPCSVTVLDGDWITQLRGLEAVGPVTALTRNTSVVHEKTGVYRHVSAQGPVGLVLGAEIDLRLFLRHWHTGMHVVERMPGGEQHSLQFFDVHGRAVHKVHACERSDLRALAQLVRRHARPEARPSFEPGRPQDPVDRPDAQVDVAALDRGWRAMKDMHAFSGLLQAHGVSRAQSFRLMEGRHTRRTPLIAVEWLLQRASRQGLPITVFAGNTGCLQIHTGTVRRIETRGVWLDVLDESFQLHLRADQIAESWLVGKSTDQGLVTSLELFDAQGHLIAMCLGERAPGRPEPAAWRTLAHGLLKADEAALKVAA